MCDRYLTDKIFGSTTKTLASELKYKMTNPDERLTKLIDHVPCDSQIEMNDKLKYIFYKHKISITFVGKVGWL